MGKKEEKPVSVDQSRQIIAQPLLLTVPEVGRLLHLSPSKVYTLLADRRPGGIPIKRIDHSVRVSLSELRRWVEQYPSASKQAGKAGNGDS